ncbi:unnamed protein product, partial [Strongylus vulgaris]
TLRLISSSNGGAVVNRRCAETANKDWCAVSYYPYVNTANFGCANEFFVPFGSATCGDGPGFINQQGCSMANTPTGPCYFCCCRGGLCNHPAIFAREAARIPVSTQERTMSLNHAGEKCIPSALVVIIVVLEFV